MKFYKINWINKSISYIKIDFPIKKNGKKPLKKQRKIRKIPKILVLIGTPGGGPAP